MVLDENDVTDLGYIPSGSCVGTIKNKAEAPDPDTFLGVCILNQERIGEGSCKGSSGSGEEMCTSNHGIIAKNACLDTRAVSFQFHQECLLLLKPAC